LHFYKHLVYSERNYQQDRANEQRFFDYNERRIANGLTPLKFEDYLARKHGHRSMYELITSNNHPQHRDNIVLINR